MSRSIRVGVDGRSLASKANRGVTRYTRELLKSLAEIDDLELVVLVSDDGQPSTGVASSTPSLPSWLLNAASGILHRPRLDRLLDRPIDVFWAPAPAPLSISKEIPLVLTVHDLSFDHQPTQFTYYERIWHRFANPRSLATSARSVISVSETTASAIETSWNLPRNKVTVIPNGITEIAVEAAVEETLNRLGISDRYFLFVGALEPRKAPELLAEAFRRIRSDDQKVDLVFVGEGRLADKLTSENTHLLGRADTDLGALYRGAIAVVCPSVDEGFGFVPLEAALSGTPAVVSDIPVFAETLGEACWRFESGSSESLADVLTTALKSNSQGSELASKANERAKQYTWDRSAAKTADVFREAAT